MSVPSAPSPSKACALHSKARPPTALWALSKIGSFLPSLSCLSFQIPLSALLGLAGSVVPFSPQVPSRYSPWGYLGLPGVYRTKQNHLCMPTATAFSLLPLCTFYRRNLTLMLTWGSGFEWLLPRPWSMLLEILGSCAQRAFLGWALME